MDQPYAPSPSRYAADHVARYEATDGADGGVMSGAPIVILHTTGRKSGALRKSPLIKVTDGERYVAIASKGGAEHHPAWYLNLAADADVRIQDGARLIDAVARTVEGEERQRLWKAAVAVWPDYEAYQQKTDRLIPVVVIEPV